MERNEKKKLEEEQLKQEKEALRQKKAEEEMQLVFEQQKQRRLELAAEEEELERLLMMADEDDTEMNLNNDLTEPEPIDPPIISTITPQSSSEWSQEVDKPGKESQSNVNGTIIKKPAETNKEDLVEIKEERKVNEVDAPSKRNNEQTAVTTIPEASKPVIINQNKSSNENNVWTFLREIKENEKSKVDLSLSESSTGEVMDSNDIDSYISDLKKMIEARKADLIKAKTQKPEEVPLATVAEGKEDEQTTEEEAKTNLVPDVVSKERMVNFL